MPSETVVHPLFHDHAVLQRGGEIPIWGWDQPGTAVTVRLAGQEKRTIADERGRWEVRLDPMEAGGPHELCVEGTRRLVSTDILVGEVWLASGQSNMEWTVAQSEERGEAHEAAKEAGGGIRLFHIPRAHAFEERETVEGAAWAAASPESLEEFSAVAWWFAHKVHTETGLPVGVIHASWGGTYVSSWTRRAVTESHPWGRKWVAGLDAQLANPEAPPPPDSRPILHEGHLPGVLYNGMIHPLLPCSLRGVIWYQGENDGIHPDLYADLFPMMIRDWRSLWKSPEMPFHFVQLAPFDAEANGHPNWAHLREVQLRTSQSLPATGMAVITDLGLKDDIHPPMKRPVGERLARLALRRQYGRDIVETGPVLRSWQVEGSAIRLHFDHVAEGLETKGTAPRGFEIAGADEAFHPATARIDGGTVVVESPGVPAPVAARFGWASCPDADLFNSDGLPASPFRTDSW